MLMRNKFSLLVTTLFITYGSYPLLAEQAPFKIKSNEEAFLVRRIAEFWKDGDFAIVKKQIFDFFEKYPQSELKDYFQGILGDLYLQENQYEKALEVYNKIKNQDIKDKTILNKLQCYYELGDYKALQKEGAPYAKFSSDEFVERKNEYQFLMAEALFRQAIASENKEEKIKLSKQARPLYEGLRETAYGEISCFALAEICFILNEVEQAAALYLQLSTQNPHQSEDLLFQGAVLQASFDREKAKDNFKAIIEKGGARKYDAAFNLLVLDFQSESYQAVIDAYRNLEAHLADDQYPMFNFIVGKSFYALENYEESSSFMKKYIASQHAPSDQLKNALFIQMTCAKKLSDGTLFTASYDQFTQLYPEDPQTPKALFMYAMLCKDRKDLGEALSLLDKIKQTYPSFEERENFLFEYAWISYQIGDFRMCYKTLQEYLKEFPQASRSQTVWRLFLSTGIHRYNSGDSKNYSSQAFYEDLKIVLNKEGILTHDETKEYQLLFAKIAYDLKHYEESLSYLDRYLLSVLGEKEYRALLSEAHYVAALNHQKLTNTVLFCSHLEEALRLNPESYHTAAVHLQLFNGYISLAGLIENKDLKKEPLDQKQDFTKHAAEHLYSAFLTKEPIKIENRLWLANYYYNQIINEEESTELSLEETSDILSRASDIYTQILVDPQSNRLISLNPTTLTYESEVIKFAKLKERQNQGDKGLSYLKALVEQQAVSPTLSWKYRKEALFELANAYYKLGHHNNALETFSFITQEPLRDNLQIDQASLFYAAKLKFQFLPDVLKTRSDVSLEGILNDLKEVQIRKSPYSEPIHLEAALEYASIRADIASHADRDTQYLFFLNRMKNDFTSQDDVMTKNYLNALGKLPKKKAIFQAYLQFLDAEILRIQAKQMLGKESMPEAEEFNEKALTLYDQIRSDKKIPDELLIRISRSIEAINSLNSYE